MLSVGALVVAGYLIYSSSPDPADPVKLTRNVKPIPSSKSREYIPKLRMGQPELNSRPKILKGKLAKVGDPKKRRQRPIHYPKNQADRKNFMSNKVTSNTFHKEAIPSKRKFRKVQSKKKLTRYPTYL